MFLVVANWKMNGGIKLAEEFNNLPKTKADVVICPPFPLLYSLKGNFSLGAQNCHWSDNGAYTGEVSAQHLSELGCKYVIIGHSERRAMGEDDTIINKKTLAAVKYGLTPIVCISEKEHAVPQADCIIAYEPIWAIGTGITPTNAQIAEAHSYLVNKHNKKVIYGGSVKPKNALTISSIPNVSGLLVGGASIDYQQFYKIITI